MARLPKLDHVKYVKRGTKVYPYFNTGQKKDGKVIYSALPPLSSPDFFSSYAAFKAARTKRAKVEYTVENLSDDYLLSESYKEKAKATQELYGIQARKIVKALGSVPVNSLTPAMVRKVLEKEAWGAATHNAVLSTLGAIYAWARFEEKTILNPVKDIALRQMGEHEPWPEHILDAALVAEDDTVRMAVHLLFFTGQRIGDVCDMTWDSVAGGIINITQEKTDKVISFRLSKRLMAELERAPRRGKTILTGVKGGRKNDNMLRVELNAFVATFGFKRVPHGLRKNAVNSLLEAGCTHHEVSSVTGQSLATIEHYAKMVNRRRLGSAAMDKLDLSRE